MHTHVHTQSCNAKLLLVQLQRLAFMFSACRAAGDQNTNPPQSRSRFTGGWHYHSASLCGGICTVSGVCQEKNKREGIVWRKNIEITKSESWHWHQNLSPTNNLIQNVIDPTSDSSVLSNARWTLFPVGATVQWQQWEWTEGPRISCIKHVWLSAAPLSAAR